MNPKPPAIPQNPTRLPKRKAVTIVAGFRSHEGIVICADTQETIDNFSKRNVPKLRFEPANTGLYRLRHMQNDLAVAFCGAGEHGPFIDKLVNNAWTNTKNATSLQEACETIETAIKDTYREFRDIFQGGLCPHAELIYGVKMEGRSKLFTSSGPVVNEEKAYSTAGIGCHLANFLAARMFGEGLNIRQCVILAAYILFETKEHVEGCGGDSHIAILRNDGTSGQVGWEQVKAITELLQMTADDTGQILLRLADFEISDEEFKADALSTVGILASLRESKREELKNSIELFSDLFKGVGLKTRKEDCFGLPAAEE